MRKNRQTAKYHIKSYIIAGSLAGAISMALVLPVPVMAAQQSLASVTGQAQIQPMGDGSGKYMMKPPVLSLCFHFRLPDFVLLL